MLNVARNRHVLGFAVAAIILAGVGLGVIAGARQFENDSAMVAHTYRVIGRIGQVRAVLFEGISAQRSFLLTGQPGYARQYLQTRPRLELDLATLEGLIAGNRTQANAARQLGALVTQRLDMADRTLETYEQAGPEAARQSVRINRGHATSTRIQALTARMEAHERELLAQRSRASARSARFLLALGALAVPLSLAILGWVYWLLQREGRERQRAMQETEDANQRLADSVHDLERVGSDLRALTRAGSLLQSSRSTPEALDIMRRTLADLLPQAAATIYLVRESQDQAEAEVSWGTHVAPSETMLPPQSCWALRRGQPHLVEQLGKDLACEHVHVPTGLAATPLCCACVPLSAQGVQLGLLYLSAPSAALLPQMPTVVSAAEQLSLALGNLRLQETLRHQSIRDPLTGLYNRRYLEESLARELARCERRGLPLTLLMLDLDHFKALNDRHGHDGGDAVLSSFGRVLQENCREEDIACRYGGEEFTLILPETDAATALRRAEQLRSLVAAMSVQHMRRELGPVTVSIGVAVFPEHATSATVLKRLADEALYEAKRLGRNRVQIAAHA
jgi:diguanylate cyclase (GGDEF)-like protein